MAELSASLQTLPCAPLSVRDRSGLPLAELPSPLPGRRRYTPLSEIPERLRRLSIGAGDRRFMQHAGVDVRAVARAMWVNVRTGRVVSGASTLTMRLARLLRASASAPKRASCHGLSLDRCYLGPRSDAALQALSVSDVVQVALVLRTQRAQRMVVVTDPLPGGFAPLDPGLSSGR